ETIGGKILRRNLRKRLTRSRSWRYVVLRERHTSISTLAFTPGPPRRSRQRRAGRRCRRRHRPHDQELGRRHRRAQRDPAESDFRPHRQAPRLLLQAPPGSVSLQAIATRRMSADLTVTSGETTLPWRDLT